MNQPRRIRLITDINTVFGCLVQLNNMQQDHCSLIYEEIIGETVTFKELVKKISLELSN